MLRASGGQRVRFLGDRKDSLAWRSSERVGATAWRRRRSCVGEECESPWGGCEDYLGSSLRMEDQAIGRSESYGPVREGQRHASAR